MYKNPILGCFFLLVFACGKTTSQNELVFVSKTKIAIAEPSGLTYHKGKLYVVSDADSNLYQITLSGLLKQIYPVKVKGMEGVTYSNKTKCFVLLSESKRSITSYSLDKGQGETHKIRGKQNGSNKGLEGVCYHSKKQSLYVVNEANPKQLLKISSKGKIKKEYDLHFAKDISGIVYDELLDVFWVLSDKSQALYKVSTKGKMLQKLPIQIKKPEGLALDENRRLYIVSDLTSELFAYQLK
jgi:uncharacterized protein YjiK